MIEAHVLDSWTLRSERSSMLYGYLNLVGGFAAPLFLWLAGLSLVLAAERAYVRSGNRAVAGKALARRGAEIFVLAFLFRAQAFIVSPGNPLVSLLRVDILNIMGPAMVATALLWWASGRQAVALVTCGIAASLIALVTPIVRTAAWLPYVPAAVQWYISPAGNHSTFTLFPWAGFVFAGAAAGVLLASADQRREGAMLLRLAIAGGVIAAGSYAASYQPSIYEASSFWTTSPTYFGVRAGAMMVALAGLYTLGPLAARLPSASGVLARLGRHSLFIYWIHVELVYGYATLFLHHRLPIWLNAVAYIAMCFFLYGALGVRDVVVGWWTARRAGRPGPETLAA